MKIIIFILLITFFCSCGTSVMITRDPGKDFSKRIKNTISISDSKKYKRMKACEEKFVKRFSKLYAKQQHQYDITDFTTPFFSSNVNSKK